MGVSTKADFYTSLLLINVKFVEIQKKYDCFKELGMVETL